MRIWAHRGCSLRFPENTLEAFEAACKVKGLTGIELDIHFTADKEIVVCHDEKVDRTTDGIGKINSFSLKDLKKLRITMPGNAFTSIPTVQEVLDLLEPKLKEGFLLNIEMKTNVIRYDGIEEKILCEIERRNLIEAVVFSSFWSDSVHMVKQLNPAARTGMLAVTLSECAKWTARNNADALHPSAGGLDLTGERYQAK
ncbi:MAG: hypothetical protein GX254_02365 [Clostridiales bacterium]|jgi:glycerophosphoryl diester phosphodiesterase|nr:hypothetical protein [Clostridiales bacterium]